MLAQTQTDPHTSYMYMLFCDICIIDFFLFTDEKVLNFRTKATQRNEVHLM